MTQKMPSYFNKLRAHLSSEFIETEILPVHNLVVNSKPLPNPSSIIKTFQLTEHQLHAAGNELISKQLTCFTVISWIIAISIKERTSEFWLKPQWESQRETGAHVHGQSTSDKTQVFPSMEQPMDSTIFFHTHTHILLSAHDSINTIFQPEESITVSSCLTSSRALPLRWTGTSSALRCTTLPGSNYISD